MKKTALLLLLIACSAISYSQVFMSQNFDVACASSTLPGYGWLISNPISSTYPQGAWHCTATNGRGGTPGMECTGVWSGGYHLDTSYLVTPPIYLAGYTGHVYLHFDTKADSILLGGRIAVLHQMDTAPHIPFTDLTPGLSPSFSVTDSTGWVTHQTDLTPYTDTQTRPFYIAFRYISTSTTGSIWFFDNMNIDTFSALTIPNLKKEILPLTVLSNSSSSQIILSFGFRISGAYQLAICDVMGRCVHRETVNIQNGTETYTINGLNLHQGMYFIKMGDGYTFGTTKVIIP